MRVFQLLILILVLVSCNDNGNKPVKAEEDSRLLSVHLVDSFGKVGFDTSLFTKLSCGLYINEYGSIGYKAVDRSLKFDSLKLIDVYLTTIYNANPIDSSNGGRQEMKFVVDTSSVVMLSNGDFRDRRHYYVFKAMLDGGTITIKDQ